MNSKSRYSRPRTEVFLAEHPVFTVEEFDAFLSCRSGRPSLPPEARKSLLKHYQARGRIVRIRRGLYGAVPPGQDPEKYPIDTFLIASRLTDDAVLAYHTALALHGISHSVREERLCLTLKEPLRPFTFRGVRYGTASPPAALPPGEALDIEVEQQDRQGMKLRVTTLERTIVDVLDRPALVGGWEEVWRSLEAVGVYLDVGRAVHYALLLNNATTAAKLGYFLGQNQEDLHVPDRYLDRLRARAPKRPHYVERGRRNEASLVKEWNLMVPTALFAEDADGEVGEIPV